MGITAIFLHCFSSRYKKDTFLPFMAHVDQIASNKTHADNILVYSFRQLQQIRTFELSDNSFHKKKLNQQQQKDMITV